MPNSEDVATLMQPDSTQFENLVPKVIALEEIFAARALSPFSAKVMDLLQDVSTRLLRDPTAKDYPDVVTFAFWCRKASLTALKREHCNDGEIRLGRGVVFHITPSNVPVNFAYSLAAGLLAGNANIVRVPSKPFPQVKIICRALNGALESEEHTTLRHYVALIRYERDEVTTALLSAHCDVRIIWGGNQTIAEIRQAPLPPRSFDLTFADRYSCCVIQADNYLSMADYAKVAQDFYNDTYLFDQNACTAPHLVVWLGMGDSVEVAKRLFWAHLHGLVTEKYTLQPAAAVEKLVTAYRFASTCEKCHIPQRVDNLLVRIELDQLDSNIESAYASCGYFYEFSTANLSDIASVVSRKFQTLAYFGVDRRVLETFINEECPSGIDRLVTIGQTLDFSLVWDGYDLPAILSRRVTIR